MSEVKHDGNKRDCTGFDAHQDCPHLFQSDLIPSLLSSCKLPLTGREVVINIRGSQPAAWCLKLHLQSTVHLIQPGQSSTHACLRSATVCSSSESHLLTVSPSTRPVLAGREMVINVEYNQLDPLLRASGNPEGDVNDPATGFSPYPGNINQVTRRGETAVCLVCGQMCGPKSMPSTPHWL